MAVFRIITFLIHAIVQAIASLLVAVFTHVVPALVASPRCLHSPSRCAPPAASEASPSFAGVKPSGKTPDLAATEQRTGNTNRPRRISHTREVKTAI